MHNSTDLLDNLLGLYASPLDWARATLPDEHNADGDARAFLADVLGPRLVARWLA